MDVALAQCFYEASASAQLSDHAARTGVVPNSDPCQIITPLVLVGLGLGVGVGLGLGLGVGLGLGNQIAISMRGVIIWQGVENGHNTWLTRVLGTTGT